MLIRPTIMRPTIIMRLRSSEMDLAIARGGEAFARFFICSMEAASGNVLLAFPAFDGQSATYLWIIPG